MTRDHRPDFVIIGAMKSGTSSLHDQLAQQPGFFMSDPKEPCYFSDDDVHARGEDWYRGLFAGASPGDLRGESSTHYTKLPTYPHTVDRIESFGGDLRFVYLLRHPVERLVSHYVHVRSFNDGSDSLEATIEAMPELVRYGCYGEQIRPFVERFGADRIHVALFEDLTRRPQAVLDGLGPFLGVDEPLTWIDMAPSNVSADRLRLSPSLRRVVHHPLVTRLRRTLVPARLRQRMVQQLSMGTEKPELSPELRADLERRFDDDLAYLTDTFGTTFSCARFAEAGMADAR